MSWDLYWNRGVGVKRGFQFFLWGWWSSSVQQSAVGNGRAQRILQLLCLTSGPCYGHLPWKMRVLLRREDALQHPVARSSCLMEIRLGIWKSNKMQARWHPSRETREPCLGKQGFQRGRAVPPASPTWCRAAAGNHKLLWATAGPCQNPSCSGYPCMCLLGCVSCVVDPWALFMTLALFSHPGGDLQAFSAVWRSMGADNCKQLQLQRSLKAPSSVPLSPPPKAQSWTLNRRTGMFYFILSPFG